LKTIEELARKIRIHSVQMTHDAHSPHIGSCLSCADILAVLYGGVMNVRPNEPDWEDRDRFIMSKGHASASLYACLAECGYFPLQNLTEFYKTGQLSGHVNHKVSGVDVSTGSLGHGLSIGCGMALAAKRDNKSYRTFVLLSDGELNEGSIWESVMFAGHHNLDNLTVIIDYNGLQAMGMTEDILDTQPILHKFWDCGWDATGTFGNNIDLLTQCFDDTTHIKLYPHCIVAHTHKGQGVSFMLDKNEWHYRSCNDEELRLALKELV
jgi:transketolase